MGSKRCRFFQHGGASGKGGSSFTYQINAGVRQGCVFSPKMFSSLLEKDRVVIGGFSDMDCDEAEKLVEEVLLKKNKTYFLGFIS